MQQIWKPIRGYENIYEISNHGHIKRVETQRVLKTQKQTSGYLNICLCSSGKPKRFLIHRLVYEAFVSPIPAEKETNHKNGEKQDNQIHNLELVTHKQNCRHRYDVLGIQNVPHLKGSTNPQAKLIERDIPKIKGLHAIGIPLSKIAKTFKVSRGLISQIIHGRIWQHVGQETKP